MSRLRQTKGASFGFPVLISLSPPHVYQRVFKLHLASHDSREAYRVSGKAVRLSLLSKLGSFSTLLLTPPLKTSSLPSIFFLPES